MISHTGKRLFLLRHALALSDASSDEMRALSPQGKEDAHALGKKMQERGFTPDIILCSPALRTRQTLEAVQETIGVEQVTFKDVLYSGATGDYFAAIQEVKDEAQNILIVGHNPTIYQLAVMLANDGAESLIQRLSEGYHPATLSVFECETSTWKDLQPVDNTLTFYESPIDYNAPARPTRWM